MTEPQQDLDPGVIGNGNVGAPAPIDTCECSGRSGLPGVDGDPEVCSLIGPRNGDAGVLDVELNDRITVERGPQLFRYRMPADFGAPEPCFTIGSFWCVDAPAAIGRRGAACVWFETLPARRIVLGLSTEDVAPQIGASWGNSPQTCALVGLIDTAMHPSRSEEERS